jgi:Leucine Rich Repeat
VHRRLFGSLVPLVLSLVLPVVLLLISGASLSARASEPREEGGDAVLNGRLLLITADRLDGPGAAAETSLAVLGVDGLLTAVQAEAGQDWLALDGRPVRLNGRIDAQRRVFAAGDVSADGDRRESATEVKGALTVLNILCRFADVSDVPAQRDHVEAMFADSYPGLGHYWRELSYGALTFDRPYTTGWHTLPFSRSHYIQGETADLAALHNDCAAAVKDEVDVQDFELLNLFFNDSLGCCAYGGGGITWIGGVGQHAVSLVEHEMGHAFGLPHSGGAQGIYTSGWDIMSEIAPDCRLPSSDFGCLGQHTIAYHKTLLGWITDDDLAVVPADGRVTVLLAPLARSAAGPGKLALKVPLSGSGRYFYTVENRAADGYDRALPGSGVIIHEVLEGRRRSYQGVSSALPAVVVEAPDGGSIWRPGQVFEDTVRGVTIQVGAQRDGGVEVTAARSEPAPFSCAHSAGLPLSECEALVSLFDDSLGASWQIGAGWGAWADLCHWQGVTCSGGHVTRLELPGNNLAGRLSQRIGDLPFLQVVDLSSNPLGGAIPREIGRLHDLRYLNLAGTALSGDLPPELAALQVLDVLYVDGSELAGPLPLELAGMDQLRTFWFYGTQLCEPPDDELHAWLDKPNFASSGLTCHGPLDKRALLPFVLAG